MNPVIYTHRYRSGQGYTSETVKLTGYDLDSRIDELHNKFYEKKPDVFVTYKSDDKDIAHEVAKTIAKSGFTAYLDILDPNVCGDGPDLVDYINFVIGRCNSLIAVVSRNTVSSWWVPLEIGIAITKGLYLGTFSSDTKQHFPSYLWKWPVLTDMTDLQNWCKERQANSTPQQFYESLRRRYPLMFK